MATRSRIRPRALAVPVAVPVGGQTRPATLLGSAVLVAAMLVAAALLLATLLLSAAPVAASPSACRVRNVDTGITKASLQAAVRAASNGDRLTVRGTCVGHTRIWKDLRISGVRGGGSGRPTLEAGRSGRVLTVVRAADLTITGLTIQSGSAGRGGGIHNSGRLVLRDIVLRGNTAREDGGGIYSDAGATLTLRGTCVVRGNTAGEWGGGIRNLGTLRLAGASSVRGNTAAESSGGVDTGLSHSVGSLVMTGSSSISGNTSRHGGGVTNRNSLIMRDSSSISGNIAMSGSGLPTTGGGVENDGAMTMRDASSISGNTAMRGGGVASGSLFMGDPSNNPVTLVMTDSASISGNTATHEGGGILNDGLLRMSGSSSITGNQAAATSGGGVWNRGLLDGVRWPPDEDPNVHGNSPDDVAGP